MPVARYIIVLDRYDDDDYPRTDDNPDGHDGTAESACEQVAAELQEAMNATGSPAGFFNVTDRRIVTDDERVGQGVHTMPPEKIAEQIGLERKMEDNA